MTIEITIKRDEELISHTLAERKFSASELINKLKCTPMTLAELREIYELAKLPFEKSQSTLRWVKFSDEMPKKKGRYLIIDELLNEHEHLGSVILEDVLTLKQKYWLFLPPIPEGE